MEAAKYETEDRPCCPICLEQFNIPRQLPCAHSFCEKCLQSHITTEAAKHEKLGYVKCPVCTNSASPSIKGRPTSEWATLFPVNTVLQSLFPAKTKVDRQCDSCNNEGVTALPEVFCVVCNEFMCGDCLKAHRKLKILKDHTILSVEELDCNPENVMKLAEGFTCSEHHGEDINYYCKNHKLPCCATCFFRGHKLCSNVIDLKEELPNLLGENKPLEIIANMKKIESHLKKFIEMNESSINNLETQVNGLTAEIRKVKKEINDVLDKLEENVKTEGNRIYKEEVLRIQDENHQCLSLIHAVRNSHYLFEAVDKYGSNLQKFLMGEKMKSQLQSYCNLVGEKYEKTETIIFEVQLAPSIKSMMSLSLLELGKVATKTISNTVLLACLQRPMKDCRVERIEVIDPKAPTDYTPFYFDSGVTCLSGDRVMLADFRSMQCILLNSSYQFITSHTLTIQPWNICVLDDQEVSVSLFSQNEIQILSVIDDIIRPVRMITTKYNCNGIAAAGKGEMVVNGYCGNKKSQWSLINMRGDVKCTHQYDSTDNDYFNYIAVNNMKTRVYVSVAAMNSLLCFDMDGKELFTYSPDNLKRTTGIAVDRYDNIYILGKNSNNLHQLSSDGSVKQVMNTRVPKSPWAICIYQTKDILIITNDSDESRKLHIYELK